MLGVHWKTSPQTFDYAPLMLSGVPSISAKCTVGGVWNSDIILDETAGASAKNRAQRNTVN